MTIKLSNLSNINSKDLFTTPRVGIVTNLGNVGLSTAIFQYISGCLGNDGKIYAFPFNGINSNDIMKVLEIDPIKESINFGVTIPDHIENNYNYGPSVSSTITLKNGEICGIPQSRNTAIFYNPKTKQYTETNEINIIAQWSSGALAPNNKIYCPPLRNNKILVIDTQTKTVSTDIFSSIGTYSDPYAFPGNWAGAVLGPNGKIYGIPTQETRVLEIDPITNTATTFGSLSSSADKWWGGVLAPNGKIYGIPITSTTILEIDPINRSTSTFENTSQFISSGEYFYNGILGADGKIYIIPYNHNKILRLDPETKTLSLYGYLPNNTSVFAGVLAPNGNIYMLPSGRSDVINFNTVYTQGALVSIGTTQSYAPANWMLSSYTNKSI
jgi:hypothetical protein